MTVIQIKRVYEPFRERGWCAFSCGTPVAARDEKDALHMDAWYKNLAPGGDLRRWFNHDPAAKWKEFQRRYRAELTDNSAAYQPLLDAAKRHLKYSHRAGSCTNDFRKAVLGVISLRHQSIFAFPLRHRGQIRFTSTLQPSLRTDFPYGASRLP